MFYCWLLAWRSTPREVGGVAEYFNGQRRVLPKQPRWATLELVWEPSVGTLLRECCQGTSLGWPTGRMPRKSHNGLP